MEDAPLTQFDADSPPVLKQLDLFQALISRMAANSASAKTWCITIVSAILVFTTNPNAVHSSWIAMFPVLTFWSIDIYYLSFENSARDRYKEFVDKVHASSVVLSDLYNLKINWKDNLRKSFFSFSVLGFYLCTSILVLAATLIRK